MTRTQRPASTTNTGHAGAPENTAVGISAWDMPGRRGTAVGPTLIILGIWGAIIPLIGPLFGYEADAAAAWVVTWDRWWLSILPGSVVIVGGLLLIVSMDRASAALGAVIAAAGGIWYIIGPSVAVLWGDGPTAGATQGSTMRRFLEPFGMFYGLGAVILALAVGIGTRALVRSRRDEDLLAEPLAVESFGVEPVGAEQVVPPRTEPVGGVERINTLPVMADPPVANTRNTPPRPNGEVSTPAEAPPFDGASRPPDPTGQPAYPVDRADPQAEQQTDPLARPAAGHPTPRNR